MASVRMKTERIRGRKVSVKVEELYHGDHRCKFTLQDKDDNEEWVYGITDEPEAVLLDSSEDVVEPDPPEWVKTVLRKYDIEVQ